MLLALLKIINPLKLWFEIEIKPVSLHCNVKLKALQNLPKCYFVMQKGNVSS